MGWDDGAKAMMVKLLRDDKTVTHGQQNSPVHYDLVKGFNVEGDYTFRVWGDCILQ